jgi:outer membrane protein assembly factor BamD
MRLFFHILLIASVLTACKSEFEQVRISNDPERILNASLTYYDKGEYLRAQNLMELILNQYRGTRQGEELFFKYAYTQYHLGNYILSSTYFSNFAATFAYSTFTEEADYMAAYSQYMQSPAYRLDQDPSVKAIDAFQDFVNKYPESERVVECNKLIDELRAKLEEKAYAQGVLYFDLGQYQAAIASFEQMLDEYPETERAPYVRLMILKSAYLYAANSVYDKRAERYADAKTKYEDFINRYPTGKYTREARDINKSIVAESKNLMP